MQPIRAFASAAFVCLLCLSYPASAQTNPAQQKRSCGVRTQPLTPGDIAFSHSDFPKAIELYRAESLNTGEEGERTHAALIRAMLRNNNWTEAEAETKKWQASAPDSIWAQLAISEVLRHKGMVVESTEALQKVYNANTCIPEAHMDWAWLLEFSDLYASAKHELDIAHALAPNDDEIASQWIDLQPRQTKIEAIGHMLQSASYLSDKERSSLEKWRDRLQKPKPTEAPCRLVTPVGSATIPYRAIQDGPGAPVEWGLNVAFNGKQRRLQIDTGASGLSLSRQAAASLHLVSATTGKVLGVGDEGLVNTTIAKVESIKIGDLEFKDCNVEIIAPKTHDALSAEDGLIGGDVFAQFLLTLDFPGHVLKLDPLPVMPGTTTAAPSLNTDSETDEKPLHDRYVDPSMKSWSKIYGWGHDLLIPVRLNTGPVHLFVIDTGAALNLISPSAAREVTRVGRDDSVNIVGISGKVEKTYTTDPLTLTFSHIRQPTNGMTSIDTTTISKSMGVEVSGFLGQPTLEMLTVHIDYRDRLVDFDYDAKRIQHCKATPFGSSCF